VPTSRTPKPRETCCQAATRQEIPKRALNEFRQALPVAVLGRLRAKRLVVLAHNLM